MATKSTTLAILIIALAVLVKNSATSLAQHRQELPLVIVVGGGVAGLNAAARLKAAGFNVILLEAQDRIGGRTHTFKWDGKHIEMGGEWVHGEKGNSVFELVKPLGLLKETPPLKSSSPLPLEFGDEFGFQTGVVLNRTMGDIFRDLIDHIWYDPEDWGEELEEDVSLGEWARFVLDKFMQTQPIHSDPAFIEAIYDWAHRVTIAEESSENWFVVSSSDEGEQYVGLEGFPNIPWLPPYSYSSLHQLILTGNVTENGDYELPEWIKLGAEVTLIEYSTQTDIVNVTTRNGTVYTGDHVIFTPSLGVLKATHEHLFQPQLPLKKQQAIQDIGFGAVTKYALEFETPWWPADYEGMFLLWNDHDYTNSSLEYWRSDITREELLEDYNGLPLWTRSILNIFTVDSGSAPKIMRLWVSGVPISRFLDDLEPNYLQQTVMAVIHRFLDTSFPNITEPISTFQSKWATNPFTRGAYSYRTMESDENDVWARDLAEPILNPITLKPLICFAGEATHPTHYATVHGAFDSGIREFLRIWLWHLSK